MSKKKRKKINIKEDTYIEVKEMFPNVTFFDKALKELLTEYKKMNKLLNIYKELIRSYRRLVIASSHKLENAIKKINTQIKELEAKIK